jgi:hypothetical protein
MRIKNAVTRASLQDPSAQKSEMGAIMAAGHSVCRGDFRPWRDVLPLGHVIEPPTMTRDFFRGSKSQQNLVLSLAKGGPHRWQALVDIDGVARAAGDRGLLLP